MTLAAGIRLGRYEIQAALGAGGMGEVYRARDTTLGRDVAIKTLAAGFASDAERLARFQREARMLASLNHVNVAQVHGFEEVDGVRALVMELVEGETLAERIARGSLPLPDAATIAIQIAEALEATHERGIVHRDLKPSNVKVRPDGLVKVLDFGVGKVLGFGGAPSSEESRSPTLTAAGTGLGVFVGTAAYMSPEQARGDRVDGRSDIWALGCVLYEMLGGRRAFAQPTIAETVAAILQREPDWSALPAGTPAGVTRLLRRCLEKEPRRRWHSAADVRITLEDAAAGGDAVAPDGARRRGSRVAVASWLVAAVAVAAAAVATVSAVRRTAPAASPLVLDVNTPPTADPASFALSPDGRVLVYAGLDEGTPVLWQRRLDLPAATRIAGTEGATQPFWAPDGRSIAFFADGLLQRLDLLEGKPRPLAHARNPLGGAWSRDGVIVYAPFAASPLVSVPVEGGAAKAASELLPREVSHRYPAFLPDGRRFVFLAIKTAPEGARACLGSLDAPGTPRQLFTADVAPQYVAPGHLLFVRGGALLAMAFDAEHGRVSGEPVELGPRTATFRKKGAFSGSSSGMAAYRVDEGAPRSRLVWVDRAGKVTSTFAAEGFPGLARDGRHIVVNQTRQWPETDSDLWLIDAARPVPARFTFAPANQVNPVWAPDMKSIAFASNRSGVFDLYEKPSGFERDERLLLSTPDNKFPMDWSPDGRVLLFVNDGGRTGEDLWTLSLDEPRKAMPFLTQAHSESQGQFSPDGRWVAYRSNETGRWEILLRRYGGSGSQRLVSTGGGIQPRWRSDGKELFYLAADSRLMAVPVKLPQDGDAVTIGEARPLFPVRLSAPTNMQFGYCVDPTGQRFLMQILEGEPRSTPITIVQNWTAALLEPRLRSGTSRQ